MLFLFASAVVLFAVTAVGRELRLGLLLALAAEELIEEREGRRLALDLVLLALILGRLGYQGLHALERLVHIAVEPLEIFL